MLLRGKSYNLLDYHQYQHSHLYLQNIWYNLLPLYQLLKQRKSLQDKERGLQTVNPRQHGNLVWHRHIRFCLLHTYQQDNSSIRLAEFQVRWLHSDHQGSRCKKPALPLHTFLLHKGCTSHHSVPMAPVLTNKMCILWMQSVKSFLERTLRIRVHPVHL